MSASKRTAPQWQLPWKAFFIGIVMVNIQGLGKRTSLLKALSLADVRGCMAFMDAPVIQSLFYFTRR